MILYGYKDNIATYMKPVSKKRVLIFSTAYYPFVGGAEVAIKEITDRFGSMYEFEMITVWLDRRLPRSEMIGNILVHRLGVQHPNYLSKLLTALLGVFKIFKLGKFDLFWCVQVSYASGPAYIYNILKFWKKVSIILTLQEGDSEEHLTKRHFGMIDLSWRLALRRTAQVTAISNYLALRANRLGYRGEPSVVPNGVSEEFFDVGKINHEGTVLITTSRLVKKNAVGDIIETLKFLPETVRLLIAGDGILRSDIEDLVQRSDLGARVKFLGAIGHNKLPELLACADIFIRPSLSEGLGISFLEAMAAGLPVIATPVGGIPDFLKDHVTGLFCEIGNPKSIASKVRELMSDNNLREKIIKNARELVIAKYNWDDISLDMLKIFNETST